MKIVMQAQ